MSTCAWNFAGKLVVNQLTLVAIEAVCAGSVFAEFDGRKIRLIFDFVCACTNVLTCFLVKSFKVSDTGSMAEVPGTNILVHLCRCFLVKIARHWICFIILKLQPKAPFLSQTSSKALAERLLTDFEKWACCKPSIRILDPVLIILTSILNNLGFACIPVAMQVSAVFEVRALIFVLGPCTILNNLLAFIVYSLLHTCIWCCARFLIKIISFTFAACATIQLWEIIGRSRILATHFSKFVI